MDSLGFALEGFDAVGRWRTIDELGDPIDASGVLPDGSTFEGFEQFRAALTSSELFRTRARGEAHDVRARARRRALRHARGARDRARRGGRGQSVLAVHSRRRQQHAVPDEEDRPHDHYQTSLAAAHVPERRGRGDRPAAARCDGACVRRRRAESQAPRLHLPAERRGEELHGHRLLDAEAKSASNVELSTILAPLAPYRDRLTVVSGLAARVAEANAEDGATATTRKATAAWLTGVRCKRTEGADIEVGAVGRPDRGARARRSKRCCRRSSCRST